MTQEQARTYFDEMCNRKSDSECWLWLGFRNRGDYGQFGIANRTVRAHRYSYEVHVGPIPRGLHVLHRCDTPSCVNPAHLFLGTQLDNVCDMTAKGRRVDHIGVKHGMAKLTEAQVIEIRRRRKVEGTKYRDLANEYGVCLRTMAMLLKGLTWRHIPVAE